MIFRLTDEIAFPDPRLGNKSGLLAIGGDLRPERLELAYHYGIFPWSSFRNSELHWYCPIPRFVIFPEEVHISHSMRTLRNSGRYKVSIDTNFEGVIRSCATVNNRHKDPRAWLGEELIQAFLELHRRGLAHSVETWNRNGELAGGFYGVIAGHCFVGDSMFSREPNTSKLALITLCDELAQSGDSWIIDCQIRSDHLVSLGGRELGYNEYLLYIYETLPELFRTPPSLEVDDDDA